MRTAVLCLLPVVGVGLPAVAASATPAPDAWVALYSTPGDYIGGGVNQVFQQSSSLSISASGTTAGVKVAIRGSRYWDLEFAPVHGNDLSVGSYGAAERAPFQSPGHPGIDINGDSRGCNSETGEFVVEDIAFADGTVSRLAIAFVQHCEGGTSALFGEVRYNEPASGSLTIQASSLLFPANYVGVANISVPLWVTNPTAAPVTVGAVTTSGAGASDVAVTSNTCPPLLGAGATCVITVVVTPRASGLRQSVINVASGAGSATVAVTDAGIGGNAAFVLDSEAGDWVGAGLQSTSNQFNSTISAQGWPGYVKLSLSGGNHWFSAEIAAPAGQNLAVGDYHDAQRAAFATFGHPGLDVYGDGRGCNTVTGQFTVREIAFDASGLLSHFAADVEEHCDGGPPALFASFRLASTIGYSAVSLQPAPGSLIFPTRASGTTSAPLPVTIANAGVLPLSVSPAITGTDAADFHADSTCPAPGRLDPAASCSIAVTFTPHGSGTRRAALLITDSTPRGHHIITLNGTGAVWPTFTYPLNAQVDVDTRKRFAWTTSPDAQAYYLIAGTAPGVADLVNSGALPPTQTSYAMQAIPNGTTTYAALYVEAAGRWDLSQSITFTAVVHVANFSYPLQGMSNADPTRPFTWTTSSQDQGYVVAVGTKPLTANLVNSGVLPASQTSYNPPPLPANTPLYATIFTKSGGTWTRYQAITFAYQAGQATFTSPLNGQRVVDMTAPYTWSSVPQAQAYYLVVSTVPGGANVINSGVLAPAQTSFHGFQLPKGVTLYGTIFTLIAGSWAHNQTITFTAG